MSLTEVSFHCRYSSRKRACPEIRHGDVYSETTSCCARWNEWKTACFKHRI